MSSSRIRPATRTPRRSSPLAQALARAPVAASLVSGTHIRGPSRRCGPRYSRALTRCRPRYSRAVTRCRCRYPQGGPGRPCYRRRVRWLLVLWDIAFTLTNSHGVGTRLYGMVFRDMFGTDLPAAADMAGRTDRAIVLDTLARAGMPPPPPHPPP